MTLRVPLWGGRPLVAVLSIVTVTACSLRDRSAQTQDFIEAARRGDLPAVQSFLDSGLSPNATYGEGQQSALCVAVQHGHQDVVRVLLVRGVDVDAPAFGRTPLMDAVSARNAAIVQLLLDAGADVNARSQVNPTMKQLIRSPLMAGGETPLLMAAKHGETDIVRLLVAHGANVDAATDDGLETPLVVAAQGAYPETCVVLMQSGADVDRAVQLANRVRDPRAAELIRSLAAGRPRP